MESLSASEKSVDKVFGGDYQFVIPNYQRPYSWGAEQCLRLIDDLEDALEAGGDALPYFLGSLVVVKSSGSREAQVIDGQQRLTTLTLLFSVVRHLHLDPEIDAALTDLIEQKGNRLSGLERRPRLDLRIRDREFFRRHVQEPSDLLALLALDPQGLATDAQRNLARNAATLVERLGAWDQEKIERFASLLFRDTFLVIVETRNLKSAHRIFSVMNSRGLDLSAADIFKSEVIGAIPEASQERYSKTWEDAEELVGRRSFEELFLHIRMVFARVRATRSLLDEFRPQVLDRFLPDGAPGFVDEVIEPYAEALNIIETASYQASANARAVNAVLRRLDRFENSDWKPVALWLVTHLKNDPAPLLEHLRALERLAAVLELRRVYTTPRAQRYGAVLSALHEDRGLVAFDVSDSERAEAMAALRGPVYLTPSIRKLALLRLNELVASTDISLDRAVVTAEHVLPQSPRPDSEWARTFDEHEREFWTHRLGNLVLLDRRKNSQAQNYDFDRKKTGYFTRTGVTPYPLTTTVLRTPAWTPAVIGARQREFVSLLADEWQIRTTSDGRDLVEEPVTTPQSADIQESKSGPVQTLLEAGIVEPGTRLVWARPQIEEVHEAEVAESGDLILDDGRQVTSPSAAASAVAGGSFNGLEVWRLPGGRTLKEVLQLLDEGQAHGDALIAERWTLLDEISAAIEPGKWTSYVALARAIGSHQMPVGQRMARHNPPNYWRVLNEDGRIANGFEWSAESPFRDQTAREVLEREGVPFADGVAHPDHYLTPDMLRARVGLEPRNDDPDSGFVPVHRIAARLGVQAKTLRWWLRRDGLDTEFKVDGKYRIDEAGAERIIEKYEKRD